MVPIRPESVEMVPDAIVAVMAPDVLVSMALASATETVPDKETASSPSPENPDDA